MKLLLFFCFLGFVAGRVATALDPRQDLTTSVNSSIATPLGVPAPATGADTPPGSPNEEQIWSKAHCRGAALLKAMTLEEDDAMAMLQWPYTQSPWDGDLKSELRQWGYLDDENIHEQADDFCDFENHHHMKRAFHELGVDARSGGQGGPNHCFKLQHSDSPAVHLDEDGNMPLPSEQRYEVDGTIYKITNAYARIGVNRNDGIVHFIHRKSPEMAAADLWGLEPSEVRAEELPKLRRSSDLAWGLWNRFPGELKIKMIMAYEIINKESADVIIPRALAAAAKPADEVLPWPGTDIIVGSKDEDEADAALALIGSPNGLGAGYFLLQHKKQLGGANFIYKIRIFKGDDEWESEDPNILFYIDKHEPPMSDPEDTPGSPENGKAGVGLPEPRIMKRSKDGKNVIREHVVWAKL